MKFSTLIVRISAFLTIRLRPFEKLMRTNFVGIKSEM